MVARLKLKGIDGGSHKRWSMWLNSRLREEPYPGLDMQGLGGGNAADAARWNLHRCCMAVVSCQRVMAGTLIRPPASSRRKAGTTSSHHGPYAQGCTRATMERTKRRQAARPS